MRCDQYIGLTRDAQKFMEDLCTRPEVSVERKHYITEAAFNSDPITGWKVIVPCVQEAERPDVNVANIYTEVLQHSPWSSGPMYFTHIHHQLVKKVGQTCDMDYLFSWVLDPTVREDFGEIDFERGHYYV